MNHLTIEELAFFNTLPNEYEKAYYLVSILFKDKTDKEGEPYIGHLTRVSDHVENMNTKIAALLHDVVEDIPNFTFTDLEELGFNEEVIELVRLVTKDESLPYHERITKIIASGNVEAIKLKYADMSDNADEERLSKLEYDVQERLRKKYSGELLRLREYLYNEKDQEEHHI